MLREAVLRDEKDFSACSIFGMMSPSGKRVNGEPIIRAMANMRERSNGLGGGFAAYGIYPQCPDLYCFHVMFDDHVARKQTEEHLRRDFEVCDSGPIPTRPCDGVENPPLLWRYFLLPRSTDDCDIGEEDRVVRVVMEINVKVDGAFVFSSGKDMGVFKGVGFPEDIGRFFRLEEYEAYLWTGHGRFPTNTQGWWGGAHPFNILDWSVVHNGEISSYGINRRFLEMYGYSCTLHTDTEVVAYAVDLLLRRQGLGVEEMAAVFAPPLWSEIDRMEEGKRKLHAALRQVYGSLLLNGPFSVIISNRRQMIGLTDRIRLRPLVVGSGRDFDYISSEEAPMRLLDDTVSETWIPWGGEAVVFELKEEAVPELTVPIEVFRSEVPLAARGTGRAEG
jgi:glutamate synthase domain-containing protein 1